MGFRSGYLSLPLLLRLRSLLRLRGYAKPSDSSSSEETQTRVTGAATAPAPRCSTTAIDIALAWLVPTVLTVTYALVGTCEACYLPALSVGRRRGCRCCCFRELSKDPYVQAAARAIKDLETFAEFGSGYDVLLSAATLVGKAATVCLVEAHIVHVHLSFGGSMHTQNKVRDTS